MLFHICIARQLGEYTNAWARNGHWSVIKGGKHEESWEWSNLDVGILWNAWDMDIFF
jgi:hypothetical protein